MRKSTILLIMGISYGCFANNIPPSGCKMVPFSGATVILSKEPPSLVLLHNVSALDVWITRPISHPSASAGWSSRLKPKHWSALALGSQQIELGCIESKPGHEQQIPCEGVLIACRWQGFVDARMTQKPNQTFWAAEDMRLPALLMAVERQGFKQEHKK